jgi:hypothetical protein
LPRRQTPSRKQDKRTEPSQPRVQFRATLDRHSVELLWGLSRRLEQKRSTAISHLILSLKNSKKLAAQLARFYVKSWPDLEPRRIEDARLFNWPVEVDEALRRLSWDAIGTGNKSETLRVLIAFFAKQHNVAAK